MKTKLHLFACPSLVGVLTVLSVLTFPSSTALGQGTAFTYQGQLSNGTNPVTGLYTFKIDLFNAATGGATIGGPITNAAVPVTNGLFTTLIDFGTGVFTGSSNWLHIQVVTNGGTAFSSLLPRVQVTPTPYAIYAETASAAGLSGTVPLSELPSVVVTNGGSGVDLTGVALLAGGNTFSGNQFIDGMLNIDAGAGAQYWTDVNVGPGDYLSGEQHSVNFNDGSGHIGSLIVGYNGAYGYFSVGNLYQAGHQTGTAEFSVFGNGNVNIDPQGLNNGFIDNGSTNGAGLTFGIASGEGIASDRTQGVNRYGLDFYTDFAHRISILQNGDVGIGITNPQTLLEVNGNVRLDGNELYLEPVGGSFGGDGLVFGDGGLPGINYDYGPWLAGYYGGALGALNPNVVALSWDASGDVSIGTNLTTVNLTVTGNYAMITGANAYNGDGPIEAYIGGNGSGSDVQVGSFNSEISNVAFYNWGNNTYMHIYCSAITVEGGSDLAEPFKITSGKGDVPQGAVVVIDEQNPGHLKLSDQSYDTHVAGVVSGANGINPGIQMEQQGLLDGGQNVALTGRVYVQADTSNGAIKPGDLLTTSGNPGCAMKVTDHARAVGAILGKAMTGLSEGKGMVLVLVTLQ
jgi:hypothetical protein